MQPASMNFIVVTTRINSAIMPNTATNQWLKEAIPCPSPNRDQRPGDTEIRLLVIHNISLPPGEFGGPWIQDLFLNKLDPQQHPYFQEIAQLQVSAHMLIRRDGALIQFVPLEQRAWHAGVSCFQDQERCNDFSIGIELEGCDEKDFTDIQYQVLAAATRSIQALYPTIEQDHIVGHSDIAPGRKTDPGPHFDWDKYRTLLNA